MLCMLLELLTSVSFIQTINPKPANGSSGVGGYNAATKKSSVAMTAADRQRNKDLVHKVWEFL